MRSILLALLAIGCGARQGASGDYRGPNLLDFTVQSPLQRVMPQERHDGSAAVYDDGGAYVTLELRIFGGRETPCRVQAQRSPEPGRMDILPGQQCTSPFRYEGRPVDVLMQVNQGTAYFDHDHLTIQMDGVFAADVYSGGRIVPTQGAAVWRFEGWR